MRVGIRKQKCRAILDSAVSVIRLIAAIAPQRQIPAGRVLWLSAGMLAASTLACSAGPCSPEIARVQVHLDARLAAAVAAAPPGRERAAALHHRQPTPRSIASVLVALGVLSPEKAKIIGNAMERARQADQAGDEAACEQALKEVERTIAPEKGR